MKIDNTTHELFVKGNEFDQILFLDNFFDEVEIEIEPEKELVKLLSSAINESDNVYVKRAAFKILCNLSISGKISNIFSALSQVQTFLFSDDEILQTISLKYLPYFSESRKSGTIIKSLKKLSDSPNGEVASQAFFCLGIIQLTTEIKSELAQFIFILESSSSYFLSAFKAIGNRVDAELFLILTKWAKAILSKKKKQANILFEEFGNHLLSKNLYEFEGAFLDLDFLVFQLAEKINNAFNIAVESPEWLDVVKQIQSLANINLEIHKIRGSLKPENTLFKSLYETVFISLEEQLYQTNLYSEKRRIEKIQKHTNDAYLISFIQKLISLMPDSSGEESENRELLAFFVESLGIDAGLELYESIKNKSTSPEVLSAIKDLLSKGINNPFESKTGSSIGHEVFTTLKNEIEHLLPNYPANKLDAYFQVVEEVIRYSHTTFVGNTKKRFSFLFTEVLGGKGQKAIEQDLQDSMILFFEHSRIADGLDHEKTKFVDGGRVDIVYKKDLITIPIELKKTKDRPNKKEIEKNYIAQAQTYTAGYDQFGIFVLLELSDKSSEPPPNFKDWFHLHHLSPSSNMPINHPDYILSVVIPGNRTSPSTKSTYS